MNSPETHSLLLDRLSERLQGAPDLWREVFLGSTFGHIRFEQSTLTLLWTDAPRCWTAGELVVLAARYGGRGESLQDDEALIVFEQPWQAARAARVLQQVGGTAPVRCRVSTETCAVAWFDVDGRQRRVVLPGRPA